MPLQTWPQLPAAAGVSPRSLRAVSQVHSFICPLHLPLRDPASSFRESTSKQRCDLARQEETSLSV